MHLPNPGCIQFRDGAWVTASLGKREMRIRSEWLVVVMVLGGVLLWLGGRRAASAATAIPAPVLDAQLAATKGRETAVIAGGCFWGIQAVYQHTKGVISATSGYSGGTKANPAYEEVSSGRSGHAESVKIVYDPSQITYGQILRVFFSVAHNPTELNRQGPDEGTQYRSVIFYANEEQQRIAAAYIAQLDAAKAFPRKIVTQVVALKAFYPAEGYHQNYLTLHTDNPYIVTNDLPKLEHLKKTFPELYRK
jgi:peptide-methionine (S)-S-oxide reductase